MHSSFVVSSFLEVTDVQDFYSAGQGKASNDPQILIMYSIQAEKSMERDKSLICDLLSSVWLVGIKGSILIPWTVIFLFCSSPSLLLFMLV